MNYFLGNEEDKWRSNVPVWGGVRYKNIYPGIDLELTSENGRSVQRFVTHSRANPSSLDTSLDAVQLHVEGADSIELLTNTHLIAKNGHRRRHPATLCPRHARRHATRQHS